MAVPEDDGVRFQSGKGLYANCGIIGIDANLKISGGYDQGIEWPPYEGTTTNDGLTRVEMLELADMMIERWQAFKRSVQLP